MDTFHVYLGLPFLPQFFLHCGCALSFLMFVFMSVVFLFALLDASSLPDVGTYLLTYASYLIGEITIYDYCCKTVNF